MRGKAIFTQNLIWLAEIERRKAILVHKLAVPFLRLAFSTFWGFSRGDVLFRSLPPHDLEG